MGRLCHGPIIMCIEVCDFSDHTIDSGEFRQFMHFLQGDDACMNTKLQAKAKHYSSGKSQQRV